MRLELLQDVLRHQPFQPFRLVLSSGDRFDVRHPELCMPGHRALILGIPRSGDQKAIWDRHVMIDLGHVALLEPIETSETAKSD